MKNFNYMNGKGNTLFWTFILLFISTSILAQPANDDPCNAIDLAVDNTCSYSNHTTASATSSTGIVTPGCGDYQGGDVWFIVVMPSNGLHTLLELQGSASFDGGIAVYSGMDCNSLVLVDCDDNSGGGVNPSVRIDDGCNFENVGSTFWVRVWENGNNDNGTFDICAYSTSAPVAGGPTSCNGNYIAGDICCDAILLAADELDGYCGNTAGYANFPNDIDEFCANIENNSWLSFIAAGTSAELEIAASNCPNSWGIQVQVFETSDCVNFTPKSNCWNPGFESSGTMAISNLVVGEIYYLHIDGWGGDLCDYVITVNHGVASISVTAQDTTICNGQSTQMQAIAIGAGPFTYEWSPTFGLNDPTSPSPIANPAASATYTVTITSPAGEVSESINITVFPTAPGASSISGANQVCENTSGVVYSITNPDASIFNWTVTGGGTIVGPNVGNSVIVDWGTTGGDVCVDISNECGSAPSTCMTVTTLVQPDISAVDPPVACTPTTIDLTTIQLTNNAASSGPISYHPDQTSAEAGWPIINPPVVDTTGTYWIRMQTGGDCYDITSVFVNIEYPDVSIIDPQPVCTPTTVELSNVIVFENGWGPGVRTYFADSLDAVGQVNELASSNVSVGGTYWMRFETPNACFDVVSIPVVIEATPLITIPQQPVICPGGQLDLATVPFVDANGATLTVTDYYDNLNFANFAISNLALNNTTGTVISTAQTYYLRTENSLGCFDITEIIVTAAASPQAQIDGTGPICPGTEAAISFDLNGVGPFDVTYNNGSSDITLTGIDDSHIEMILINANTTFTLVSISDQTACPGMVVGSPVTINVTTAPTADITGDISICGTSDVTLNFALTGNGPFDVVYTDGTNDFTLDDINDGHAETVPSVSSNQTFVVKSITDADGCSGTFSGDAVVQFYDVLQIVNLNETCNVAKDGYVVSFEIVGGDPSSYNVTGSGGALVGNVYTSVEITNNTAYNYTISDASTCPSVDIVGLKNCQCLTDPGTMQVTPLEACANETVTISTLHNSDEALEINDLLMFALHDNSTNSLGNLFELNTTGEFTLMPGMNTGDTYYISPVAGPNNGSGSIDMGHLCFNVGQGIPIVFHALPQAVISGGGAICIGEDMVLTFNFNAGTAPFDVVITDGTNTTDLNDIVDGHTITVNPLENKTYSIVSVSDNTSASCDGFGSGIAPITINEVPIVGISTFTCNSINTEFQMSVEITGGDASTYNVTGVMGTLDAATNIFTTDWMPSGSSFTLSVDDANACGPNSDIYIYACDCTTATVAMDTETLLLCEDETVTGTYTGMEVLDGNDVLGFVLHDLPGSTIGTVFATNNIAEFNYDPSLTYGTTYYISAVVGDDDGSGFPVLDNFLDPCLAIAPGQPVVFTELPIGSISGTAIICEGSSTDLTFNFNGSGPYDIVYTDGVNTFNENGVLDGHTITVSPEVNTTFVLIEVELSDAPNCMGTINPTATEATISIIDVPEVENVMVNCNTAGTDYRVTFDIVGGDASNYFVDGDLGTLTGSSFTSNWKQSGLTYNFEISDGTMCAPIVITDVGLCNCTPDIKPYISVNGDISCPGDSDGILSVRNLNGIAPYSFEWSNGGTETEQTDLNQGMYIVTMTDGNGCISIDSLFLSDPDSIRAELMTMPVSCYGATDGTFTYANVSGGTGDYNYELDAQASYIGNEFYKLKAGTYGTTITDALGCTWEGEATVEAPEPVMIDLGETKTINYGDSIQLEANFNQAIDSFFWTPEALVPCTDCRKPYVRPFTTITYTITAFNEFGCYGTEEIKVNVLTDRPVYIPNIFSPNGDDINDEFMIYSGVGVVNIKTFRVYSRWGEALYERNDIDPYLEDFGWNGKANGRKLSTGVYIYYAEIEFADGSVEMFRGDITLLR